MTSQQDFITDFNTWLFSDMDRILRLFNNDNRVAIIKTNSPAYSIVYSTKWKPCGRGSCGWHKWLDWTTNSSKEKFELVKRNDNSLKVWNVPLCGPLERDDCKGKAYIEKTGDGNFWIIRNTYNSSTNNDKVHLDYVFERDMIGQLKNDLFTEFAEEAPQWKMQCCTNKRNLGDLQNNFCQNIVFNPQSDNCDQFMTEYCEDEEHIQEPVCGCFREGDQLQATNEERIIYDWMVDNKPTAAVKSCILPECRATAAYKTYEERQEKCPTICAGITNVQAGDYSYVNIDDTYYNISCNAGDQVVAQQVEPPPLDEDDEGEEGDAGEEETGEGDEAGQDAGDDGEAESTKQLSAWQKFTQNKILFAGSITIFIVILLFLIWMLM